MMQKFKNPIFYSTLGLVFLIIQIIGQKLSFFGFYGILLLFIVSIYHLLYKIKKEKKNIWRSGVCFIISSLILLSSFLILSSTFIFFKNIGKDKIEIIEYTFEGFNIGTSGYEPKKSNSVFKIGSLEPNETKMVRINRYKYPKGVLKIINKDTIARIVEFYCSNSKYGSCIIHKNIELKNIETETKVTIDKNNNSVPENFPTNFVVDEWYPSAFKGSYIFYENGNYIFIYGGIGKSEKYDIGNWELKDNIINIHIYKEIGLRPIGKPLNPEVSNAANPEEYYEYKSYKKYEKSVNKNQNININDFLIEEICYINKDKKATDINIKIKEYLNKKN